MITVVVKATVLRNLAGRDDYISNPERQENLVYVHESIDDPTMQYTFDDIIKLQQEHMEKQNKYLTEENKEVDRCEGHEFMLILDNELSQMDPKYLGEVIASKFKEEFGTPAVKLAFHWNKTKTSYHVHGIVPEYNFDPQIKYGSVETRNRYYDENGKQSTKKACLDENGNLKSGCQLVKKGDRLERATFFETHINEKIKSKRSLANMKKWLADYMNEQLQEEKYRWDKDPLHIKQQSIGIETSKNALITKEIIKENNALVQQYNYLVDTILEYDNSDETIEELVAQKQELQEISKFEETRDNTWFTRIRELIEDMILYIERFERGFKNFFDDIFNRRTSLDNTMIDISSKQVDSGVLEHSRTNTSKKRLDDLER